ncbi:branched-chain amino acid ABC transporter permease [Neomoorella thermoacetica]|uniref:branched-chain amino acid ABC transporter permease n=1 Tax=Neomoorella thermoacetica TaxID=1525 RepID=UPI0030CF6972
MLVFFQQVLNALQLGSVYALIALGYTMVYGILTLINFAHGDIFMVSTYIAFFVGSYLLMMRTIPVVASFLLTMFFSMIATAILAVIIERVAYRPLRQAPRVSAVITALGVGLFLENFTLGIMGAEPRKMPLFLSVINLPVGGVTMTNVQLIIIGVALLLMFVLDTLVMKTMTGMAMRAISFDKTIAPLMGVPVNRIISYTFAIGSAVAAAGGMLYGMAYPVIDPYMGIRIGWWAFIAAVVGGIGDIRGAMIGGFILGFIEIFTPVILPSSTYRDFVAFTVLLLFLVFRPTGILGKPMIQKV